MMPHKLLIASILSFGMLLVSSCNPDRSPETDPAETQTKLNLTVKNADGALLNGIRVHLYKSADSNDPRESDLTTVSNEDGVAVFSLKDVVSPTEETNLSIKVIETYLSLENVVIGSLMVTIPAEKPEIIERDLIIDQPKLRYQNGFVPSVIDSRLAQSEYERWKSTQVIVCADGLRVKADPANETRVEAIGFGTILAAYANDQETFDGLMRFYESKRTNQAHTMMGWLVTCDDILDPGSATDGDIDVAFANIIASTKWGNSYLEKAREIIAAIREKLILDCSVNGATIKVLAPGYSNGLWGGCELTDIQYYTPAYFRLFAQVSNDEVWNTLADDTYTILNASAHPTTGLVPDWQTASGTPGPGDWVGYFGYDACRVPWRITLDYLWNGNENAALWSQKVAGWANAIGPENIVDGYELDGTPNGVNGLNSAFLGGFSVAMMTTNQAQIDNFSKVLSDLDDNYWFNLNTRVLYLFTLTGNFQKPEL